MKKIRIPLMFGLLLFSIALLVWSFLPAKMLVEEHVLQPSMMAVKMVGEKQLAILETRRIRLEWPNTLRIGEEGAITLDFADMGEDSLSSEQNTGFVDAYSSNSVMAEGNFEVAGVTFEPVGGIRMSMPPGQPVRLKWKISSEQEGQYHAIVWLSLRFLPLDGSTPTQVPIYVKDLRIQVTSFLGMKPSLARLVGGVGLLISLVLMVNEMINLTIKRNNKIVA